MPHRQIATMLLLSALPLAVAGDTEGNDPGNERACDSTEHRAFDFWLGRWNVTAPDREGWQAQSTITLDNDGCSIHEAYRSPGGYAGRSINFYEAGRQLWHQTWIDNQGAALYLEGGPVNGAMVLSDGTNRISWSRQDDGRVRQHWEVTQDGGKSWSTAFDGYYEKRAEPD